MTGRCYVEAKHQTGTYREAVRLLRELDKDNLADRAFAEAVNDRWKDSWHRRAGLRPSSAHGCISRVLGKRCDHVHCHPPATDHPSLAVKGKEVVFISQPYGITWGALQAIVDYCREHGLEATVDASLSWHFPSSMVLLEYRKAKPDIISPQPPSESGVMARPSKYTEERAARVSQALSLGATYELAAAYAGISPDTLARWRKAFAGFADQVQQAEAKAAMRWLITINQAADRDWRAATFMLERRYPHDYGRSTLQVEHTGKDGSPITFVYRELPAKGGGR